MLAFDDDIAYPNTDSALSFVAPQAGDYYIGVSSYSDFTYDPTVSGSGSNDNSSTSTQGTSHMLILARAGIASSKVGSARSSSTSPTTR